MKSQGFTLGEVLLALFLMASLSFNLIAQQSHIAGYIKHQIETFYLEILQENKAEYKAILS